MNGTAPHCSHRHDFDAGNPLAERGTRRALALTAITMLVEIAGGWWFNSMAVLADGWHMSSHALALGLSVFAYAAARRYAADARFAFGTWKIEVLGGYTSAIVLLGVAVLMAVESLQRLVAPGIIHYREAIAIAIGGLLVNLICAWWLRDPAATHGEAAPAHAGHHDAHAMHGHAHAHHHDINLRSAYMHVLADAATSVLAIIALVGGLVWGAAWLDPAMGVVGAILVASWARGLLRDSGRVLLDAEMDTPLVAEVRAAVEQGPVPAMVTDLHVWRVGRGKFACLVSITTASDVDAAVFRAALAEHEELVHVTIEITRMR
jgi:cation diffusion facilitator family transporter